MSNLSPNEHSKDKKRSFFGRLFNFASHTMKSNKKSINNKKIFKKSSDINLISKTDNDEIETCTFCDYCDKEIVAKFTGQNFICHIACRNDNVTALNNSGTHNELISPSDSVDFKSSRSLENELENVSGGVRHSLSSSLGNLSIIPYADDETTGGIDLVSSSIGSSYHQQLGDSTSSRAPLSTMRRNHLILTSNIDTYTFSTVDLSTIKQYGISIKKLPSIRNKTQQQIKERTAISTMPNDDPYESLELPGDLTNLINIFNDNDQGLFIEEANGVVMGKVRVYINLLRPIKMLLTARPPSMLDQYSDQTDKEKIPTIQRAYYNKEAIFWLPRGTTNVVYINVASTTTADLISMLLTKFNIQNNPKKFALYEHTITSSTEVEVRKLSPLQFPSQIMLKWCLNGKQEYQHNLKRKRFVLQENDPGAVEWDEFYLPELNSFLKILIQEELEKRSQIIRRYEVVKKEIERCMSKLVVVRF